MGEIARLANPDGVGEFEDEDERKAFETWTASPELIEFSHTVLATMQQIDWTRAGASQAGKSRAQAQSLDLVLYWLGLLSTDLLDRLASGISLKWVADLAVHGYEESVSAPTMKDAKVGQLDSVVGLLAGLAGSPVGHAKASQFLLNRVGSVVTFPPGLVLNSRT
jgi:hypothetical protein